MFRLFPSQLLTWYLITRDSWPFFMSVCLCAQRFLFDVTASIDFRWPLADIKTRTVRKTDLMMIFTLHFSVDKPHHHFPLILIMMHVFTTTWISSTSGPASYSASPRSKFMLSTTLLQVFLLTTLALTQARPRDPDHYLTPWQRYSFSAIYIYIHFCDFFLVKYFTGTFRYSKNEKFRMQIKSGLHGINFVHLFPF